MRFRHWFWTLCLLLPWSQGATFRMNQSQSHNDLKPRQASEEDENGLYDGGFGLGGYRDKGTASFGTDSEQTLGPALDGNARGEDGNGWNDDSDSQDHYWDALSHQDESTQSDRDSNGEDDFDMGSDQDDAASDHYLYEDGDAIGYSHGRSPDLRTKWTPDPNRDYGPDNTPLEEPEADSSAEDEDYPRASFIRVSYCDEAHTRKIHRAALEIRDVLNTTVERVARLIEYVEKRPIPPLHEQPPLLASTLRTFSSFCDDYLVIPRNPERPAGQLVIGYTDATAALHKLWEVAFAMLNYTKHATKNTRFTEVTCGIPWITREDDLGRFRPGYWFDNRETTENLHRDDRWFRMKPIQLPYNRLRPWDISDGFPVNVNHRSRYIRTPKLVGTLEHMKGRYDYVVVLQSWDQWWGWQDAPFMPYAYQSRRPGPEDFDIDNDFNEDHPLYAWSWAQFRRNRWMYPTGSIHMPYLVFRRLMPALLSAFAMSDKWVNYPATTIDFGLPETHTLLSDSVPFEGHVMPWTKKYKGPPSTFGDVIADLYSDPRLWKYDVDWKTFTWFAIAMYADQYDWSSGMNRPLGTAYLPSREGDFLGRW